MQLFARDVGGSSELRVRDEAGNITTLSPHNFSLIGAPSEPLAWAYYSENAHGRINVDMLRAVRLVESLSGETLVFHEMKGGPQPEEIQSAATLPARLAALEQNHKALRAQNYQIGTDLAKIKAKLGLQD